MKKNKRYKNMLRILLVSFLMSLFMSTAAFADTDTGTPTESSESSEDGTDESDEVSGGMSDIGITIGDQSAVDLKTGEIISDSGYAIDVGGTAMDADGNLKFALDGFLSILFGAASVTLVFGLGKMFLSFKDDKPEEKVNASMYILASIIIFSLRGILDGIMNSDSGTMTE